MFESIKSFFLKRYLANNKIVREKTLISLQQAKNIGLMCEITNEASYKEYFAIFSAIQKANRNMWLLGYIDDKIVPFYCLEQLTVDFFCNKDLNWYGKPQKIQVLDYEKKAFDMLIDFTKRPLLPIRSILELSQAKCIVGGNKNHRDSYDLFIGGENDLSSHQLLKNIDIYTQKLTGEQ